MPTLPETPVDAAAEAAILQSAILIVDDQAAHVHLLERLLQDAGYVKLRSTTDPTQVAALQREHQHDLILLDLQMPGRDGFEVMAELAADAGTRNLPVIALTAQPMHKLRALQAGARDFINKPFETVEVKLRIHHMLEVRLLHQRLAAHNRELERLVQARTAALQASEARYRSLTELAVDWYWEQDETGQLTTVSGPVMELLGRAEGGPVDAAADGASDGWDTAERQLLKDNIAARKPFLDLLVHRRRPDGSRQPFRISGQPMFDRQCGFIGYRGLGVEVRAER